jgi:hypothetical protein
LVLFISFPIYTTIEEATSVAQVVAVEAVAVVVVEVVADKLLFVIMKQA